MIVPTIITKEYPFIKDQPIDPINFKVFENLKIFTNDINVLTASLLVKHTTNTEIPTSIPENVKNVLKVVNRLQNKDETLLDDFTEFKNIKILFLIIYKVLFDNITIAKEQRKKLDEEKIAYIQKLLTSVDISNIYEDLEDRIFKFLEPKTYKHYEKLRSFSEKTYLQKEKEIRTAIYNYLHDNGINLFIKARLKSIYSIHKKIKKKNILFSQLLDIIGLRIIVPKIDDCYQVLELLIYKWQILNSRIKDYISIPKENGYKSLHVTILYNGIPVEIQIRTQEMHIHAEYGLSSHFDYKNTIMKDLTQQLHTFEAKAYHKALLNEEGYKFLFHNAPVGLAILDKQCKVVDINFKMLQIVDNPPLNKVIGKNLLSSPILHEIAFTDKLLVAIEEKKNLVE